MTDSPLDPIDRGPAWEHQVEIDILLPFAERLRFERTSVGYRIRSLSMLRREYAVDALEKLAEQLETELEKLR